MAFTKRIYEDLIAQGATPVETDPKLQVPINPFTNQPLLLVPDCLLRDLPAAFE